MSDHDELIAALRAEREARERAEAERDDAYVRGMAAGQAAMPKGTLTVIDSPEIAALRERVERAEAMVAELRQSKDEAVLAEKMRMMDWCAKRAAVSRAAWERASRKAVAGDMAELRNRVALIDAGPMDIVLSATDASGPSAERAEAMVAAAYRDAAKCVKFANMIVPPNVRADLVSTILARTPADAQAALDRMIRDAEVRGQAKAGAVFATSGAEARWISDGESACPACGGSGDKGDAQAALDRMLQQAADEALERAAVVADDHTPGRPLQSRATGMAISAAIRAMKGGEK